MEWPNPIPRPLRNVAPIKSFVVKKIRDGIADEWEQRKQHLHDLAAQRARKRVPSYLRKPPDQQAPAGTPQEAAVAAQPAATEETASPP
jgi:hypothetical protein